MLYYFYLQGLGSVMAGMSDGKTGPQGMLTGSRVRGCLQNMNKSEAEYSALLFLFLLSLFMYFCPKVVILISKGLVLFFETILKFVNYKQS